MEIQYKKLSHAEKIIYDLGIRYPTEIDLDAIANTLSVEVNYRSLSGCEAHIIGHKNSAIATINENSSHERKRFSLAHELGHWHHHKGQKLICRVDKNTHKNCKHNKKEKQADTYASNLLLPNYLFCPILKNHRETCINTAKIIAKEFSTSLTSTLIKIVETSWNPLMLICYNKNRRLWFTSSGGLDEWWPSDTICQYTDAYNVLSKSRKQSDRNIVSADTWFDKKNSEKYEILEEGINLNNGQVLVLLEFTNIPEIEEMEEEEELTEWKLRF